jgi:hypothetical protein
LLPFGWEEVLWGDIFGKGRSGEAIKLLEHFKPRWGVGPVW